MNKIKGFDGLRGIAVLLVIFSHGELWKLLGLENSVLAATLTAQLGVNVFFLLSGFLITSLLIEEQRATGSVNLVNFYIRRSLRIFPLYFLSISIMPILMLAGLIGVKKCTLLHAFTYTLNFAPKECVPGSYSHFWSLAVEEHFYLIWPLVFLMGNRFALVFMWTVLIACLVIDIHSYDLINTFRRDYFVNRWTIPAAAPIAMGCIAAYYRNVNWVQSAFRRGGWIIVLICSASIMTPLQNLYVVEIATLGFILFIYLNQSSMIAQALEWKPLAWIGTVSYGLYVWQGVLGGNGSYRESPVFPPPLYEGLGWALLATVLSYYLFEKPIMRLKHHFSWQHSKISNLQERRVIAASTCDSLPATDDANKS